MANINEFIKPKVINLVKFGAEWCGPCKVMDRMLDKAMANYPEVNYVAIDVDANPELAGSYGVRSIPCMAIFKDGQLIKKTVGAISESALSEFLTIEETT